MQMQNLASQHNPIACMVPDYLLERLANSSNAKVRSAAIKNLRMAVMFRTRRATLTFAPRIGASTSITGKKERAVYDARGGSGLPGFLARAEGAAKSKDISVNEAYDHSGFVFDFFKKNYGRNSLDDQGMRLISSVHVGDGPGIPMSNAYWDGAQMAYGDGDGVVFTRFSKALDVVGHELTHGVTSFTSNLIYQGQSGALNEHFSDVFGVLVRQWRKKQTSARGNWLIGDEIIVKTPTRRALRDMEYPGTAFVNDPDLGNDPQPNHMSNLYRGTADHGGVHINSGIPNRAFVIAAKALGGSAWIIAGRIWYDTLLQLHASSNFADCARISRQIAHATSVAAGKAVDNAWRTVGL